MTRQEISYWLNYVTDTECVNHVTGRICYHVGDRFTIEVSETHVNLNCRSALPNIWFKRGYIPEAILSYYNIQTFYTEDGTCMGKFNPTLDSNHKINFDYIVPVTQENKDWLVAECVKCYIVSMQQRFRDELTNAFKLLGTTTAKEIYSDVLRKMEVTTDDSN